MPVSAASFRSFKRSDKTDILENGISDGRSTWKILREHLKDIASGSVTDYYRLLVVGRWIGITFDAKSQAHIEEFCAQDRALAEGSGRNPREVKRNFQTYDEFLTGLRSGGVERDHALSKLSKKAGSVERLNKERKVMLGIHAGA